MKIDKNKIVLFSLVAVLIIVLAVLLIVALGELKDRKNERPQTTTSPTIGQEEGADVITETPYGKMVFPGKYSNYLTVEQTENPDLTISYVATLPSGKVQKLFDIRFGEALDPAVGQVVSAEGLAVGVHVTIHPYNPDGSWSVTETDAVTAMLENLNDVLAGLNMVPVGTPIPEILGEEMAIDTPYCKLYLPKRWLEELRLATEESDGYDLVFSAKLGDHETVKIFAVNFGGSEAMGQVVHTLMTENDVPFVVRARIFDLDISGWSAVDQNTVMAMQEDLNHLLQKLTQE